MVFSLENEASFKDVYKNYSELSKHRNIAEMPIIAVGTQGKICTLPMFELKIFYWVIYVTVFLSADKISSTNVRVIEDKRVQQLCIDIRRCTYYETCATYGLNVDRVFTESEFLLKMYKIYMIMKYYEILWILLSNMMEVFIGQTCFLFSDSKDRCCQEASRPSGLL